MTEWVIMEVYMFMCMYRWMHRWLRTMLEEAGPQGVIAVDYTSAKLIQHLEQAIEIGLAVILRVRIGDDSVM